MNKTVGVILAVLIVGGVLLYLSSNNSTLTSLVGNEKNSAALNDAYSGQNSRSTPTTTQAMSSILLRDVVAGNSVVIQSAKLSQPGYVVIYRTDNNGIAEKIGHSSLLQKADYTGLPITLDTPVEAEQTIVAVLHKDDGDGVFEVPGNDGYLGSGSLRLTTDVDVVDVPSASEPTSLKAQVEAYLDYATSATSSPY